MEPKALLTALVIEQNLREFHKRSTADLMREYAPDLYFKHVSARHPLLQDCGAELVAALL